MPLLMKIPYENGRIRVILQLAQLPVQNTGGWLILWFMMEDLVEG